MLAVLDPNVAVVLVALGPVEVRHAGDRDLGRAKGQSHAAWDRSREHSVKVVLVALRIVYRAVIAERRDALDNNGLAHAEAVVGGDGGDAWRQPSWSRDLRRRPADAVDIVGADRGADSSEGGAVTRIEEVIRRGVGGGTPMKTSKVLIPAPPTLTPATVQVPL